MHIISIMLAFLAADAISVDARKNYQPNDRFNQLSVPNGVQKIQPHKYRKPTKTRLPGIAQPTPPDRWRQIQTESSIHNQNTSTPSPTTPTAPTTTLWWDKHFNDPICGTRAQPLLDAIGGGRGRSRQGRIIGGREVQYGAVPWQADLRVFRPSGRRHFEHMCGGAIIGRHLVLTAAHCLQTTQPMRVFVGSHRPTERERFEHSFRIDRVLAHPGFRPVRPYRNDIALIRVRANTIAGITFNEYVRPICLPNAPAMMRPGSACSVTGWGEQRTWTATADDDAAEDPEAANNPTADALRAAVVPILDDDLCSRSHAGMDVPPDSMLCAGFMKGGVDACQGDSGGPLSCVHDDDRRSYLVGVVSWGDDCARRGKPGVYTKVYAFVEWIESGARMLMMDDDDGDGGGGGGGG